MAHEVADDAVFHRVYVGDRITAKRAIPPCTACWLFPPGSATAPGATQGGMRLEDLAQMALANNTLYSGPRLFQPPGCASSWRSGFSAPKAPLPTLVRRRRSQ